MAGIAGASRDGVGMVGVAPDADLAIAKVTNSSRIGFSQARDAIAWGASIDATVANLSANAGYSNNLQSKWIQLKDGSWSNSDPTYIEYYHTGRRSTGFYNNEDPKRWSSALGNSEMVVVVSAGNSGLAFPENPAPMAYATREDGSLYMNGQMLVVGAYDIDAGTVASYSNKAGHICQGFNITSDGNCNDTYRMSDFYILAPGNMYSPGHTSGDGYVIGTGTSEAAAVVSGAVAIIHQQWPLMTGSNIVKLLTATANKDLPGYDKDIMGAGLLDLEAATRPYGVVGIPVDGRYGKTVPISGSFLASGSDGLSDVGALSSVMVTDEFGRDYYVDMSYGSNTKKKKTTPFNPISKGQFFTDHNPYDNLNYYTSSSKVSLATDQDGTSFIDMTMKMNQDTGVGNFEFGHTTMYTNDLSVRVGFGVLNEDQAWMGNEINGALGEMEDSYTTYTNITGTQKLNKRLSMFGGVWYGYTQSGMNKTGLVTDVSDTQSYSWNVGLDYTVDKHSIGTTFSQPVTIHEGTVDVSVPVGYYRDGSIAYDRSSVDMSPDVNAYNVGMYYKFKSDDSDLELVTYGEHQLNYLNQEGETNNVVGFSLQWSF